MYIGAVLCLLLTKDIYKVELYSEVGVGPFVVALEFSVTKNPRKNTKDSVLGLDTLLSSSVFFFILKFTTTVASQV